MSLKSARELFRQFFDRAPERGELQTVSVPRKIDGAIIGTIKKLTYHPTGDADLYEHVFEDGNEPQLFVSDTGEVFLPIGGAYVFTPRGFEG
jgi:hypothetical protein